MSIIMYIYSTAIINDALVATNGIYLCLWFL